MRYEILGPLRVVDGGQGSSISARKVETLLAVLLTRADQVVPTDLLMEEIWGTLRPRRAMAGIHVYISQIRKFLARQGRGDSPVVTRSPGYVLRLGTDELDYLQFQHQVNIGRSRLRDGRYLEAIDGLESALGLWRGTILSDLCNGPILGGFVCLANESRLECLEMLIDARLQVSRHRELVGLLYSLVADYPLREAFYRQLMLALYRSERQAEALEVFQTARSHLREELGVEPCKPLQEVQRSILVADDRLMGPVPAVA
jgi:DNA-binding SARP family transcriptional activator